MAVAYERPHLVKRLVPWDEKWPDNIWIGTTVEDNVSAQERIPKLLDINAKVKFLSCEPLLESLDLSTWIHGISWVITGGETGPYARPTSASWFREIRDICIAHDVPFHFKQWGDWSPLEEMDNPGKPSKIETWYGEQFIKVGKKKTGRMLDQIFWNQLPVL